MATATQTLPPFLQQLRDLDDGKRAVECSFTHSERLGLSKSHCLWWPSVSDSAFETVVLFIPGKDNYYATEICSSNLQVTGNPGLVGFYEPFLDHIYSKSRPGTAILAHAELGHSPHVESPPLAFTGLEPQVCAVVEAIDAIRALYGDGTKLVVIGHSIGTWLSMRVRTP